VYYHDWLPFGGAVSGYVIVFCRSSLSHRTVVPEKVLCWADKLPGGLVAAVEAKTPCLRPSVPWAEVRSDLEHIRDVEIVLLDRRGRQRRKLSERIRDRQSVVGVHMAKAKARDSM